MCGCSESETNVVMHFGECELNGFVSHFVELFRRHCIVELYFRLNIIMCTECSVSVEE